MSLNFNLAFLVLFTTETLHLGSYARIDGSTKYGYAGMTTTDDECPLHLAVRNKEKATVNELLTTQACDVNTQDKVGCGQEECPSAVLLSETGLLFILPKLNPILFMIRL